MCPRHGMQGESEAFYRYFIGMDTREISRELFLSDIQQSMNKEDYQADVQIGVKALFYQKCIRLLW